MKLTPTYNNRFWSFYGYVCIKLENKKCNLFLLVSYLNLWFLAIKSVLLFWSLCYLHKIIFLFYLDRRVWLEPRGPRPGLRIILLWFHYNSDSRWNIEWEIWCKVDDGNHDISGRNSDLVQSIGSKKWRHWSIGRSQSFTRFSPGISSLIQSKLSLFLESWTIFL